MAWRAHQLATKDRAPKFLDDLEKSPLYGYPCKFDDESHEEQEEGMTIAACPAFCRWRLRKMEL
jgi:hypothetical protein